MSLRSIPLHWSKILFLSTAIAALFTLSGYERPAQASQEEKVAICHVPPGNPAGQRVIWVSPQGASHHLTHHALDTVGVQSDRGCIFDPQ